jgi:hypothetical protein
MLLQIQSTSWRIAALLTFSVLAITIFYTRPAFPQDLTYHRFVDDRTFLGVPNALNVLSNIPFFLVGIAGLIVCRVKWRSMHFCDPREGCFFVAFSLGVALTALGSSYYHLAPGNERLLWDRLPVAIAFMGLFAAIIAERVNVQLGLLLLIPLVLFGLASVVYWDWTERIGQGDLRFYYVIQFYPMLVIPLMLVFFSGRYTRTAEWFIVFAFYVLAKVCEQLDGPIYEATNYFVSGHTLKHLLVAVASLWVIRIVGTRLPCAPSFLSKSAD